MQPGRSTIKLFLSLFLLLTVVTVPLNIWVTGMAPLSGGVLGVLLSLVVALVAAHKMTTHRPRRRR